MDNPILWNGKLITGIWQIKIPLYLDIFYREICYFILKIGLHIYMAILGRLLGLVALSWYIYHSLLHVTFW